jgi:hypothetical protein
MHIFFYYNFHRHDGYSSELCGTALPNFTRWLYVTMLMLHLTQGETYML